ncbi:hypothetical protein SBRCBS47491_001207 [Sporothrix bragantina]|uniref:Protein kinase domain-containing protein n=1 Tax=Sporothrix bragantina TaxID=671064 RepID=A0ABP0AWP6_9PEZI
MDLSSEAIHDVIHATAAFAGHPDDTSDEESDLRDGMKTPLSCDGVDLDCNNNVAWAMSQLNPKNRIDSLEPIVNPLWMIDGAAGFGTQFYAYPVFLNRRPPPMHIDVFIREGTTYPRNLRRLLDLDRVFHTKDKERLCRLGIATHIQRILQYHSTTKGGEIDPKNVELFYRSGTFGMMFIIDNLTYDVKESHVTFNLNHSLESELRSFSELKTMWGLVDGGDKVSLPPEVDISRLGLMRQMHDSISVVQIYSEEEISEISSNKATVSRHHGKKGKKSGHPSKQSSLAGNASEVSSASEASKTSRHSSDGRNLPLYVLKSVTSQIKFLYQELRAVLKDIPPHEGILTRPLHIITKRVLFGSKVGVVGFTMPLYPQGSLRDLLPLLRIHGRLTYDVQLRWAIQITDALHHVWTNGNKFYYPDLRLDNVVMSGYGATGDIGLIDFEQRGVWCSFSSPEVDYIESLRVLAFDDDDYEYANSEDVCSEYLQKLKDCYDAAALVEPPPRQPAHLASKRHPVVRLQESNKYSNPWNGYNVPWNCLVNAEKEAAMVYMLGRLIWCICEGMSAPHRGAVWMSYPREPEIEFPTFRRTPEAMRDIILKCFGDTGAREQSQFVRQGSKLYIKEPLDAADDEQGENGTSEADKPAYKLVSEDLAFKAREFWYGRLAEGDAWLQERNERLRKQANKTATSTTVYGDEKEGPRNPDGSHVEVSAHGRPTLRQVLSWLTDLEERRKYDVLKVREENR